MFGSSPWLWLLPVAPAPKFGDGYWFETVEGERSALQPDAQRLPAGPGLGRGAMLGMGQPEADSDAASDALRIDMPRA